MNTLEHTVVEILEFPKQVISEQECCWRVIATVECEGGKSVESFKFTNKTAADRIVIGYTYLA